MWLKIVKWAALAVGIIIAIGAIALLIMHAHYNRVINKELARIRAEGYPVTFSEINAFYPYPKGPNAASAYERAFNLLYNEYPKEMPVAGSGTLPPVGEPLPGEMRGMIRDFIEHNAAAISALRAASNIKECRYPVDFGAGFDAKMPHLGQLRCSARLLELAAIYDADAGRHAGAAEHFVSGIAVARSINHEPNVMSLLVGNSIYEISLEGLSYSMSLTQFDETALQSISDALRSEPPQDRLSHTLIAERCTGFNVWNHPEFIDGVMGKPLRMFCSFTGIRQRDQIFYLKTMRRLIEIAELPLPEQMAAAEEHDSETRRGFRSGLKIIVHKRITAICSLMLPAMKRVLDSNATCIARIRCAQAAVLIEKFRLDEQSLPTNLNELMPEYLSAIPIDPFSGKPVLYKKLDKGYVVYSVGGNLIDDGGVGRTPGLFNEDPDIIFQVIR